MDKKGPIVLVDDDEEDLQMLIEIFADLNLPNEIHLFKNTNSVVAFLQREDIDPFLIISDINMPVMNGFELRDLLKNDEAISGKRIPYIYFSSALGMKKGPKDQAMSYQGIFPKPVKHSEWRDTLETIVKYWTLSMPSASFEF
jgi:CheY-like chemotaxis protein